MPIDRDDEITDILFNLPTAELKQAIAGLNADERLTLEAECMGMMSRIEEILRLKRSV
jgi:hypothetical protein